MDKVLYKAAVNGDIDLFTEEQGTHELDYFLRKNSQNNHIIHIAVRHERIEFIQEAVKRFPQLICEANCDGDNPLHLAAKIGNLGIVKLLFHSYKDDEQEVRSKPWRAKNKEGNTPLHVALIHGNIKVALFLVEEDGATLALIRNNFEEIPLHLAIQHRVDGDHKAVRDAMKIVANKLGRQFTKTRCFEKESLSLIKLLLHKECSVACWRDTQELTPLLRAATLNPPYLLAIESIVKHCPESVEVCDGSQRNLLHLMNKLPSHIEYERLLYASPELEALKNNQDIEGNTPSHVALQNQNIDMFLVLLKSSTINLTIKNKDGVSVSDLIKKQSDVFWDLCKAKAQKIDVLKDWILPLSENEANALLTMDITFLREEVDKFGPTFLLETFENHNFILTFKQNNQGFDAVELEFIQQVLEIFPTLMCQVNKYGSNPLHDIAIIAPNVVNRHFLDMIRHYFLKVQRDEASTIEELCYDPPWKAKDKNGNTPLHLALKEYGHIRCARLMLEFDPELAVEVNKSGETPLHLLSQPYWYDQVTKDSIKMEDLEFMVKSSGNAVNMKDANGLTPLLRAAKSKNLHLVKLISHMTPHEHVNEKDHNNNTFWHLLADMRVSDNIHAHRILFEEIDPFARLALAHCNNDGNTPVHLAIKNDNFEVAHIFNESFKMHGALHSILEKCNKDGNTPFHMVACRRSSTNPLAHTFIQHALDNSFWLDKMACVCNKEGNTSLHLAILNGNFQMAQSFIQVTKWLEIVAHVCNNEGNTPLHLAILKGDFELSQSFMQHAANNTSWLETVASIRNNEGNTPLHLAILKGQFHFAQFFIESAITKGYLDKIMEIPNNKDDTPGGLIGSAKHLSYEFEEFLWRKPEIVEAMLGVRSLSGVPTEMIKEYTNTIGVTAALLATITFTAAFTVPGGLNSNNGTPLLMQKPAFQVFIVSDILAMCFSMMVLFCLLWIMTIGYKKHQVVLLDLTVFLLEAAFYTTLLTFMMGLYVTVFPTTSWIAILACILCSLLILLMHKRFITGPIPCFIRIYVWFRKGYSSIREPCRHLLCSCKNHQHNEEASGKSIQTIEQAGRAQRIPFVSRICALCSFGTK